MIRRLVIVAAGLALAGCGGGSGSAIAGRGAVALPAPSVASPAPTAAAPASPSVVAVARRTPCTANHHRRWVFVSLRRQHLWMCARSRVVRDTAITSGMAGEYTETPTGTYEIQAVDRNTTLTLATGEAYPVKYWIPFDAPLFGFHDSSWQRFPYGSPQYRTDGSHGCVHVPLAAIRFLAGWARVGTPVTIRR